MLSILIQAACFVGFPLFQVYARWGKFPWLDRPKVLDGLEIIIAAVGCATATLLPACIAFFVLLGYVPVYTGFMFSLGVLILAPVCINMAVEYFEKRLKNQPIDEPPPAESA